MKTRKPSDAQRRVLERMAAGEALMFDRYSQRFIGVRRATGMALSRAGYLFQFDAVDGIAYFRLSDAGRAASAV